MKDLSAQFPVWLCDIWGVVHDGQQAFAPAVEALTKHRQNGGKVVLLTNAPRPKFNVQAQLDAMGVSRAAYDDIVSSGDVTRGLMANAGQVFHMGPQIDLSLYQQAEVKPSTLQEAKLVICTGFFEDRAMKVSAYRADFEKMRERELTMICANPDKVVRIGPNLVLCAGTLAEAYAGMGGEVVMAGKPFTQIYDLALAKAGNPPREQVLVIGDGPETDVKGAEQQNLACYFISGGINTAPDVEAQVRAAFPKVKIVGSSPELYWT
ncbi:MAG TPA: TIGR01459 family HAD-type hydrolase [Aestuariivirga sp.]